MEDVLVGLPAFCLEGSAIWRSRTSLICFHIVELHLPDRILRQFGLLQHIPEAVEAIQRITSQGRSGEDWTAFHAPYIQRWADRLEHIAEQSPFVDPDPIRATSVGIGGSHGGGFLVLYSGLHLLFCRVGMSSDDW
ncbi:Serine/threonine-protein phosphatase [Ananas comosus]|uniref:Serine/threonine-protein phosphatase n=1 Tax=Ananas comosus TaxID=4615 RepID=A0A199VVW5_ANACO|nr:Serine/threonine-protein phosphatase [Ananas comosus]